MPARRSTSPRKIVNYTWAGFVTPIRVVVPVSTKVLLGTFTLSTAFEETITRVRGVLGVYADTAAAVEDQVGAFGMIIVTDLAVAAGAAAIPSPATDSDDDGWFLWQGIAQRGSINLGGSAGSQYVLDSKAQRILREGSQIAVMVENFSSVHAFEIVIALRALARFRS